MVIDDDEEMRSLLGDFYAHENFEVDCFSLATEALSAVRPGGNLWDFAEQGKIDLIVTDLKMAQMDGMELLKVLKKERPEIPVILITAFGSIDTAIEAMKNGAYHYLVKPFKLAEMKVVADRALEKRQLSRENLWLRSEVKKQWNQNGVLGKSPAMLKIFDLVERIACSTSNVLITGESGTGKERIARLIHEKGTRKNAPFVAINCSAIPETLLESELFGHAKGSFTGAVQRKKGLFEEANGGTLFLDEIGDMSPALQVKLLRVLQEKKIRAVGDTEQSDIDVRIIAATHKDLRNAIRVGEFREDLYYRLSVIPIVIPPLRERKEDIPILVERFIEKFSSAFGSKVKGVSQKAMNKLIQNRWEGNVRELENAMERLCVLSTQEILQDTDINLGDYSNPESTIDSLVKNIPTLAQLEERYIRYILDKTGGKKEKAAQMLGLNRRTLYRKEREYGWVTDETSEPSEELSAHS
jgi:DNA-binding NtrC family response regulator